MKNIYFPISMESFPFAKCEVASWTTVPMDIFFGGVGIQVVTKKKDMNFSFGICI